MSQEKLEQAKRNWEEQRAYYERELSIVANPSQKFELKKRIEECEQEIESLEKKLTQVDSGNKLNFPQQVIQTYLELLEEEIENKYKYGQALKNYISLSGMQTQAYQEAFPKSTKFIPNLDQYLISQSPSPPIVVYGSPGSGKSTTLYKTFVEYKKQTTSSKKCQYIPVFIHANEIANVLDDLKGRQKEEITSFLSKLYENTEGQWKQNFAKLLAEAPKYKLVVIIDALDEFVDKKNRGKLFSFLANVLEKTYQKGTKWILSCREKEYRAFANQLKVINVRIKSLSPTQFENFLRKRLKESNATKELSPPERREITRVLNKLTQANKRGDLYLTNPYYLSLWVDLIAAESNSGDDYVPTIDELHERELKREFLKSMKIDEHKFYQQHPSLIINTKKVLSVLSYYILEQSLKKDIHEGVAINDDELLKRWVQPILEINNKNDVDKITNSRLKSFDGSDVENINYRSEEPNFIKVLEYFKKAVSNNWSNLSHFLSSENKKFFIVVLASIIDQAFQNNIIKFKNDDIDKMLFERFTNQRAGDYLAACYLRERKDDGLSKVLRNKEPNFWLSRAIALAIASSEEPRIILEPLEIPEDYVFESAIVDGLILMQSKQKESLSKSSQIGTQPFLDKFIKHLLKENRFNLVDNPNYDVCAPFILLGELRRLLANGYSDKIEFPDNFFRELITKELKEQNIPVCRELYLTWFVYACNVKFNLKDWLFLVSNFFKLAGQYEFDKMYNDFKFSIKDT